MKPGLESLPRVESGRETATVRGVGWLSMDALAFLKEPAASRVMEVVLLIMTALGALFRFWRLGRLGLVVDEGFQVLAVEAIYKHGYPQLESGQLYLRSILFQYLQAGCAWLVGLGPLALRIPAAAFGVMCIPMGYLLGREFGGRALGLALGAVIALSAWEVELSRYGRFYTLLQLLYMLGLLCFWRGFINDRWSYRFWYFLVTAVAISVHPLGVMLGLCFLVILPLWGYSWQRKVVYVFLAGLVGSLTTMVPRFIAWVVNTLRVGKVVSGNAGDPLAAHASDTAGKGLVSWLMEKIGDGVHLPSLEALRTATSHQPWLAVALTVAAGMFFIAVGVWAIRNQRYGRGALLVLIMASAFAHLLMLALVLGLVYLACFVRRRADFGSFPIGLAVASLLLTILLLGIAVYRDPQLHVGSMIRMSTDYPDVHRYLVRWLAEGWPWMTPLLGVGVIVMARHSVRDDGRCTSGWFILGSLFLPTVVTSVLIWKYSEARYFFHLYPLLMLIWITAVLSVVAALVRLTRLDRRRWGRPIGAGLAVVALLLTADAGGVQAAAVASRGPQSPRHPIRGPMNWKYEASYYQDWDGIAEQLKGHMDADDLVMMVGPRHNATIVKYYLGRLDYSAGLARDYDRSQVDDELIEDPVLDATAVTTIEQLDAILDQAQGRRLWIITIDLLIDEDIWYLDRSMARRLDALIQTADTIYRGRDGHTFAARLIVGAKPTAGGGDVEVLHAGKDDG